MNFRGSLTIQPIRGIMRYVPPKLQFLFYTIFNCSKSTSWYPASWEILSTQPHIVESRDHPLLQISAFSSFCLTEVLRLLIIISPFPLPAPSHHYSCLQFNYSIHLLRVEGNMQCKSSCFTEHSVLMLTTERKASHKSTPILLSAGPHHGPTPKVL